MKITIDDSPPYNFAGGIYDKRLDNMSLQEIFDESKNHLLKQNKKSENEIACLYRGNDGLKCAAGIFIPDEDYDVTMEENGWGIPRISQGLDNAKSDLINALQGVHDAYPVFQWEIQLGIVHSRYVYNIVKNKE